MNELETLEKLKELIAHIDKNNWTHLYNEPLQEKLIELKKRKPLTTQLNQQIATIELILTQLL